MNPPKELLDRMLADGELGVLVSTVCLGAALAIKAGRNPEIADVQSNKPVSPELKEDIRSCARIVAEELQHASPEELDRAIALYSAHLKEAGYTFTAGQDN